MSYSHQPPHHHRSSGPPQHSSMPHGYYAAAPPPPPPHRGGYDSRPSRGPRGGQSHGSHYKSRRLYVGNIPYHVGIAEDGMVQLFSALYVAGFRPLAPGEMLPVASFWMHADGKFGFMEVRGDSEAVDLMQLNGIVLHGRPLRVNRPSDYQPDIHGVVSALPSPINIHGIQELCAQLGGVLAPPAHLMARLPETPQPSPPPKVALQPPSAPSHALSADESRTDLQRPDPEKHSSAQTEDKPAAKDEPPRDRPVAGDIGSAAKTEDADQAQQDLAEETLPKAGHGDEKDKKTTSAVSEPAAKRDQGTSRAVQNVEAPALRSQPQAEIKEADQGEAKPKEKEAVAAQNSFIIVLRNLATSEDLDGTQSEYEDLVDDVREECSNYGTVIDISIPREGRGRGCAFIAYGGATDSAEAIASLKKRVFSGNAIDAALYPDACTTEDALATYNK